MIAISSFRPLAKCSPERQEDFIRAKQSWDGQFEAIFYYNVPEPRMSQGNTVFKDHCDERPHIAVMADLASRQETWVALINADIVVSDKINQAEFSLGKMGAECAISRRFVWPDGKTPEDWGLDFFCATPQAWRSVRNQIPSVFTLGRIRFDTWLCTFFCHRYPEQFYDLTPNRLIFHPVHGERVDQHLDDPDNFYLKHPAYPKKRLKI